MNKISSALILILISAAPAYCRDKVQGYCEKGGVSVVTSGMSGTPKVQASYPSCTVTVYGAGTLNLASIFEDNAGTAKANPFTASNTGLWFFYADNGRYDVRLSGTVNPAFTLGDIMLSDPASGITFPCTLNQIMYSNNSGAIDCSSDLVYSEVHQDMAIGMGGRTTGTIGLSGYRFTASSFDSPGTDAPLLVGPTAFKVNVGGPNNRRSIATAGANVSVYAGDWDLSSPGAALHGAWAASGVVFDVPTGSKVSPWAQTISLINRSTPSGGSQSDGVGLYITASQGSGGRVFGVEQETYDVAHDIVGQRLGISSIVVDGAGVGTVTMAPPSVHGAIAGQTVFITGSPVAQLEGQYAVQTIVSPTIFTIQTSGVGAGTYNNNSLTYFPFAVTPAALLDAIESGTICYVPGSPCYGLVMAANGAIPSQIAYLAHENTNDRAIWVTAFESRLKEATSNHWLLNKVSETGSDGLYRLRVTPSFEIQQNSANGRDFSTYRVPIHIDNAGVFSVRGSSTLPDRFQVVVNNVFHTVRIGNPSLSDLYFDTNDTSHLWLDTLGGLHMLTSDLYLKPRTPASAGAAGTAGQIAVDADYIYVCIATNTWKRVAITTWP